MKPVKQERLMFRVSNDKEGRHIIHNLRKSLNSDSYAMRTKFTGPRPMGTPQGSTLKENAKSIRVYIDSKRKEDNINIYDYVARGREIERGQQNTRVDQVNSLTSEVQKLSKRLEEARSNVKVTEAKLSLLTQGLQNSNKYRKFLNTVESITDVRGK